MRYFLSRSVPPFSRVLLVESGSRDLFEELLSGLYNHHPANEGRPGHLLRRRPKEFPNRARTAFIASPNIPMAARASASTNNWPPIATTSSE